MNAFLRRQNIGLILNAIGAILIAIAVGSLSCNAGESTCGDGVWYPIAYIVRPDFFRIGLISVVIGSLLQLNFEKKQK